MKINDRHTDLRAMTITELLIVMLLSSIVILSVMEGMRMVVLFTGNTAKRIEASSQIHHGYSAIESLLFDADSVMLNNEILTIYNANRGNSSLYKQDSTLIVAFGESVDTLLRRVASIDVKTPFVNNYSPDTLRVNLRVKTGWCELKFPLGNRSNYQRESTIEQIESRYTYND